MGRLIEEEIHTYDDVMMMSEYDMIQVLNLPIGVKNRLSQLKITKYPNYVETNPDRCS